MKKKYKKIIVVLVSLLVLVFGAFAYYKFFKSKPVDTPIKEVKVTNTIENYGYNLEDRDTELYKEKYEELKKLLSKDDYDKDEYIKLISELFIIDLFTIDNKISRYDVGGTEFMYTSAVASFKASVENSLYKTVENDLEDNRIDNIHELQRSIYDFQVSHEDAPTLENYLQDISLYTDNDAIDQGQYVSLMSIHMAKGLEFDYVFVLGLSEGIFPSFRSLAEDGDDGLEEERRLAYVAFTRAKKQLFLTDSEGFSFVTDSPKISSRFIDEVGNEGIVHSGSKPRFKTTDYVPKQTVSKAELIGDNKVDDWKVGDLVNHDIFGKGVVVKVNKNILDIAFELPAGLKSLMANHKALKKLTN